MAKYIVTPSPLWVNILKDQSKKALYLNLKKIQLKPVKGLLFKFDPWHQQTLSIRLVQMMTSSFLNLIKICSYFRDFLYHISASKYRNTNPRCALKTEILSNREDPELVVSFGNILLII